MTITVLAVLIKPAWWKHHPKAAVNFGDPHGEDYWWITYPKPEEQETSSGTMVKVHLYNSAPDQVRYIHAGWLIPSDSPKGIFEIDIDKP